MDTFPGFLSSTLGNIHNRRRPQGGGRGGHKKQTKGDENWYLFLAKATSFLTSQNILKADENTLKTIQKRPEYLPIIEFIIIRKIEVSYECPLALQKPPKCVCKSARLYASYFYLKSSWIAFKVAKPLKAHRRSSKFQRPV